ncbi:phage tail sheath family protein [Yinghuangia seranimata]|uniref:phage tail sheath family protein n=1 Tax=Yinghuangia seranimata TaxID=408067 RepID=UPI00248CFE80|nr:phage tail sheath subtilisin-like domain-containing protein [Yinghuangia seranimata]MDI2131697.1 phage tail sheath subtilisin-like domain-containing protein [Yinghuangia seranimata]
MPVQPLHPGVYIQEQRSGVHTITGQSTSVTAFVGAARQGVTNTPVSVRSLAEYVRVFGPPLDALRPMGHAVGHFFANGGSQALVVRVAGRDSGGTAAAPATATLSGAGGSAVKLAARSPGTWANRLGNAGLEAEVHYGTSPNPGDQFTLVVRQRGQDPRTGATVLVAEETYAGLSMAPHHPRYVLTALADSQLVTAEVTPPGTAPTGQATSVSAKLPAATVQMSTANGTLRVAVDYAPPTDLVIATNATPAAKSLDDIVTAIDTAAASAGLSVDASHDTDHITLTTTGPGGPGRAVTVLIAPSGDAGQSLGLGLSNHGTEVSGAAVLRPTETGAPVPFTGGTDGIVAADDVVPQNGKGGIYALDVLDFPRFNLLCLPDVPISGPDESTPFRSQQLSKALEYCRKQHAFLLADTPPNWLSGSNETNPGTGVLGGETGAHGAVYYPRITVTESAPGGGTTTLSLPTCGAVAGIMARTDANRGVWKAPAGLTDAGINGISGLSTHTDDDVSDVLNPKGVNVLRVFPGAGSVLWGARTLAGSDVLGSEFKYIPVRRLTDYIETSLFLGTQFAVFEPNDPDLWAQLRLAVGTFMRSLFRAGAFQRSTSGAESDSYFVICDDTVNPQSEIDLGKVNVVIGFAPLKPAEFVVLTITQISRLEA